MPAADVIGTVKILSRWGAKRRFIKISHHGSRWSRWVPLARHRWEQHHGRPVPDGHQIGFADGDPLNDAIENLVLLSPGRLSEQLQGRDLRSKKIIRKWRRKQRIAVVKANRRRGAVAAVAEIKPAAWYVVLHVERLILMRPCRSRRQAELLMRKSSGIVYSVERGESIIAGSRPDGPFEMYRRTFDVT